MFNVDGGKLIVIILAALVVLGPEELPGMLRRVGRLYGELRRLSDGVQHDLRSTFADPANELRQTSDLLRTGIKDLVDTVTNVSLGRDDDDLTDRQTATALNASTTTVDQPAGSAPDLQPQARTATTTVWPPPAPAPPESTTPATGNSAAAG